MKTLNIFIFTKDRELQLKALLDSFFKYLKTRVQLKITIFYDMSNTECYFHHGTFRKFMNEISHFNLIEVNFEKSPPVLEDYFVAGEYNLVIPDNTIFCHEVDLTALQEIHDNEILDLFKGMNRQKCSIDVSKSLFLSEAGKWTRINNLYKLDKEGVAFEQLPTNNHFKYYGKIFTFGNETEFSERSIYFYPLSPCFINGINKVHDFIDFYDVDVPKEYNPYGFSVRYACDEHIDIDEIQTFSPNSLMYQYPFKFKKREKNAAPIFFTYFNEVSVYIYDN